jgi:hypothetical protein
VHEGRAVKVQGDPDHLPTHGALCTKVSRYPERSYHPERVLQPLRRVGPKGSGRFEPVSWDAALDEIAVRLKSIALRDAQAIVPYSYAGTMGLLQGESMAARFFHRLGASLLDRTICASAGGDALTATYGGKLGMHLAHYADSRLILIWGSNSIASNLHFWTFAQAAKRNGAKLVCIDPRRTETADKCHQHRTAARHRRCAGMGLIRAGRHDPRPTRAGDGGRHCASVRNGRPERRGVRCGRRSVAGARLRHIAGRDPLNTACSGSGGGNAVRLITLLPGGPWQCGGCCCRHGLVARGDSSH